MQNRRREKKVVGLPVVVPPFLFASIMARRKRGYLDEGYSSDSASSSSGTVEDEQKTRRRRTGKEDAVFGIFGEDGNEREGGIGRTVQGLDRKGRRIDYLRGQAFVAGSHGASAANNVEVHEPGSISHSESDEEENDDNDLSDEHSEAERYARQSATEEEEMETRNAFGTAPTAVEATARAQQHDQDGFRPASFTSSRAGIGSATASATPTRAGIGAGRAGIGSTGGRKMAPAFTAGGNGIMESTAVPLGGDDASALSQAGLPTTFGQFASHSSAFSQRASQVRQASAPSSDSAYVSPSISFKTGSGSGGKFDPAKYLAQMGWSGGGLGKQGEGIVNPIEVKQRPERAGIAFGGLKEKTRQAKEEARRRGEVVSSDEEGHEAQRKQKEQRKKSSKSTERVSEAWTKAERKPRKPKVEHRTYEQILEEQGHLAPTSVVGQIIDASGNEYSSISAALAKHSVPTSDSTQLIELRHNLRLICDGNKVALDRLASEGAAIQDRQKWLERDHDEALRRKKNVDAELERIKVVLGIVRELETLGKKAQDDTNMGLDAFEGTGLKIASLFKNDIVELELDAALVGAILPVVRRMMLHWSPLEDPTRLSQSIGKFAAVLRIGSASEAMTPYDALLWNVWMPPVRSSLNNHWDVRHANAATKFFRAWQPLLSPFVRDNVTQQLILPKLRTAISDWDGKEPLYKIVFPWLPILGTQMDDIVSEAKRRLRSSLKTWKVSRGVPSELLKWRDVFRSSEWNSMLLHHVVDKLSAHLDSHLHIDPRSQDMRPLDDVLSWKTLLGSKILSKLLLARFVPKWIKTLHAWLVSPSSNLEEVAQWYEHWKTYLQQHGVGDLHGIQIGFQAALTLMEEALRLGPQRSSLPLPDVKALQRIASIPADHQANTGGAAVAAVDEGVASSFRQVVEEAAAEADLIVQPLNRTEVKSGMPLYRISRSIDGKGGVTFYLEEDVVFAERRVDVHTHYEPVSIDELVNNVK